MTPWIRQILGAHGLLVFCCIAHPANADGFESPVQSVRGLGYAHSGEAVAQGLDNLSSNPAAISSVRGRELYFGLTRVDAKADVSDAGSTIVRPFQAVAAVGGVTPVHPVGVNLAPSMAVAWRISRQLSAGISLATPFGFDLSPPEASWARYQGVRAHLAIADLQTSLAWRPSRTLSVGLGLDATYGKARLSSALPNLSPVARDGRSVFAGDGWDMGWVTGVQWRPVERLTLGASYRSTVGHSLAGTLVTQGLLGPLAAGNGRTTAAAKFSTPSIAIVGARWRASDRLTVTVQAQRSGWSQFDTIRIVGPGAPTQPGSSGRDTTAIAMGAEFVASPHLTFRAGVQNDPQAIAGSAVLTDGDRRLYGAGLSYGLNETSFIDAAVAYLDIKSGPIDADVTAYGGTPLTIPVHFRGQLAGHAGLVSLAIRKTF